MMLQEKNVFSIAEVDYAILEPDGKLSLLKKMEEQEVNKRDMKIPISSSKYLPSEIIADGKIIRKNVKEFNLNEKWLSNELKKQKISSPKEVLYAEIQNNGNLYIQRYH